MSLKKLGIAVVAVLAVGAVMASSALAGTAETRTSSWVLKSGTSLTSEAISCKKVGASNLVLKGTIAGSATELTATGIECIEASVATGGTPHMATAAGKLKFTGVSVVKPEGCSTPSTNTTNALKATLQMDKTENTRGYVLFEPSTGATGTFTSVVLEGCAAEGKYPVKGSVYGQATNNTASFAKGQNLAFNATTAGMSSLTLGTNAATITGEVANELSGTNSGAEWGAEEK